MFPGALDRLAQWTPVALNVPAAPATAAMIAGPTIAGPTIAGPTIAGPTIDWGDLRGVRFSEPFFDQTVDRWAGGDPAPLVRTDLDALLALDAAPSLDPVLLIGHLSRCGSTLLARLLGTLPGTLVVAEPAPLNALLALDPARTDRTALVRAVRLLVRALGRRRFGDETRYVLKLSSWNIRRIALLRDAFPGVPLVWVQRAPGEVLASLLANPPGWLRLRGDPAQARALFGLDNVPDDRAIFAASALATMLDAATVAGPDQVVDYRDLPDAAWCRTAPLLGVVPAADAIARMREEAEYDAKSRERRRFTGDPPDRQALRAATRTLAALLDPLYRTLDARIPGSSPQDWSPPQDSSRAG